MLPVAAVLFAVAGVFATGSAPLIENVRYITAASCIADGTCSQSNTNACQLQSNSAIQFVRVSAPNPCTVVSTGLFVEVE
jgi:hypothetical protein